MSSKRPPFNDEQNALMEKWYKYSIFMAYKKAHIPHDDHEVRTAAHDALMDSARYYQVGKGYASFQTFYIHCLLQRLSRAYHKRVAASLPSIGIDEARCRPPHPSLEAKEYSDHLRQSLPLKYQDTIYQCYDMGMSNREIARVIGCRSFEIDRLHKGALYWMSRGKKDE